MAWLTAAEALLAQRSAASQSPLRAIAKHLEDRLEKEAAELDTGLRMRIEAMIRGLTRRGGIELAGWQRALGEIGAEPDKEFVDWLAIERFEGHETDIGLYRHWIDPTKPFAELVAKPAHGVLVTSATLTDSSGDAVKDWEAAEARTGSAHLARARLSRARAIAVRLCAPDPRVHRHRPEPQRHGRRGGRLPRAVPGVGRRRARPVHRDSAPARRAQAHRRAARRSRVAACLAQHVDGMDTATLVDIFRAEEDACLLGTDAVRDGVDVPGRSLRLIVFDRVPWPRPDILHKARRAAQLGDSGAVRYDDRVARLETAPGLRPPDSPRRRYGRVRAFGPADAVAPARRLPRGRHGRTARIKGRGGANARFGRCSLSDMDRSDLG